MGSHADKSIFSNSALRYFANGQFFCFAGTNFCNWEQLVFLAGD